MSEILDDCLENRLRGKIREPIMLGYLMIWLYIIAQSGHSGNVLAFGDASCHGFKAWQNQIDRTYRLVWIDFYNVNA